MRLFGGSYSLIDHYAANNCTTVSFAVFNSSHNMISNNTADYPFTNNLLITDGSSYNTASNNVFVTADFVGILVADPLPGTSTLSQYGSAHDNLMQGNLDHTDGPTGAERHSGIAPSFVGGIVVLNGTYNNTIVDNQVIAASGTDLAWAQVIPDTTSPIDVAVEPPVVHCNVTVSEDGGGVANVNGNVWSGNTARKSKLYHSAIGETHRQPQPGKGSNPARGLSFSAQLEGIAGGREPGKEVLPNSTRPSDL